MAKNKITKKRTNIVTYLVEALKAENPLMLPSDSCIAVVKNSFYHSRLYIAVRKEKEQVAHIILSRKKDYILKIVMCPEHERQVDIKAVKKYVLKTFPCKEQKLVVGFSELAYSEQHPNDMLETHSL